MKKVLVVGAGMAGSDLAYFLAENGIKVCLIESKRTRKNAAQKSDFFAELVCTNSLKSLNVSTGHGLLKTEMNHFGSLILKSAYEHRVPAGDALAVDREAFSKTVTSMLQNHPNIEVLDHVVSDPLDEMKKQKADYVVLATGPLTHPELENWIQANLSQDDYYFYDAIAPVVDADSLDLSQMYFKDRRKDASEGPSDYLNIPLNKEQYENYIQELINAEKVPPQDFEKEVFFEACLPIDLMAERGVDTARFSCMRPVGLELENGEMPYAVIQLRKENLQGDAYNLVGHQTRLKYPEQKRIFRTLPGMANAEFLHLGSVHRNSYLNTPKLLNPDLSSKKFENLYFAGQITGVEGYTESAAMGLYVGFHLLRKIQGHDFQAFPNDTAMGSLVHYLMTAQQLRPTNMNFGLLPSLTLTKEQRKHPRRKSLKKELQSQKAQASFKQYIEGLKSC